MSQTVRGVIARTANQPVEVVDIVIPDPGPGEAVVRIQACGVCHTDLHYREGGINNDFPFLLGHEAAGVVDQVGPGVTEVAVGDYVILNWRAVCGQCRACRRGRPQYCFATHNATQKMTLTDGTVLSPALGIGAFADKTLVAAGQCTKVDPAALPQVAGLLGCGVMAGLGAAINTAGVSRGDSLAVIGCGGVGAAAVAGGRLAGAGTIVALDIDDRKLATASSLGATHTINTSGLDVDAVVAAIQEVTGGFGADVVIEAVGRPETYKQAFYGRDLAGTVVLVGVPTPELTARASADRHVRQGRLTQVVLVRRLPSGARLPDADRPVLARTTPPRRVRERDHRTRRRRGGVHQDAARRRAAFGGTAVAHVTRDGPPRSHDHLRAVLAGRRHVGRRQQRLAGR